MKGSLSQCQPNVNFWDFSPKRNSRKLIESTIIRVATAADIISLIIAFLKLFAYRFIQRHFLLQTSNAFKIEMRKIEVEGSRTAKVESKFNLQRELRLEVHDFDVIVRPQQQFALLVDVGHVRECSLFTSCTCIDGF